MQTTSSIIKGMLTTLFFTFIGIFMPRQRKRLFIIAGIHAKLIQNGVFHEESINKLNGVLHLTDDDKSLDIPESVYESVWDSSELSKILHQIPTTYDGETCMLYNDAKRVTEEILKLTPKWLQYGSLDEMSLDLINLFMCQTVKTA